jgi:hypothetical protein
MRVVQALPLLLLLVSAVSCSSTQTAEDPSRPPPPKTTVEVRNLKQIDFNLYVLNGTHRIRLGTAPGMTTRTFVIPPHLIGEKGMIRFGLDPIGSDRTSVSEESLPVHPGEQIALTIQ